MIGDVHVELQEALRGFLDDKVGEYVHRLVMSTIEWEAAKLLDTSLEVGKIRETQGRVLALQEFWNAVIHAAGIAPSAQEEDAEGGY